jgi:hypothetical protein
MEKARSCVFPQAVCAWFARIVNGAKAPFWIVRGTTDHSQRNAQVKSLKLKDLFLLQIS